MKRYQKFGLFVLVNAALLYTASMLFPTNFELGNNLFTPLQAAVFAGFVWNLPLWYAEPIMKDLELSSKDMMTSLVTYLLFNFVTLWLLARFSFFSGVGIGSFVWVAALALVANFVQYATWQWMEKKR